MDTYADDLAALIETLDLQRHHPRRPFDRRRRGDPLHRPPRHRARRQGGPGRRHPAPDAEDRGQSRRPADRGIRRHPRRRRGGSLAVLQGPERSRSTAPTGRARRYRRACATQFWLQIMQVGLKGAYDCIKAFSETDFTEDLKRIDVPTLIIHGDDDQIVPIDDVGAEARRRSSRTRRSRSIPARRTA